MKITITLNKKWFFNPVDKIGNKGGFGEVFKGESESMLPVAIKRINVDAPESAKREIRIAEKFLNKDFQHIVKVLDSGYDDTTNFNYIVMELAQKSLQDDLNQGKPYLEIDALEIIIQICAGLLEVPDLVHRDLKPSNILYCNDRWKIADFGIAKFVEETTSLQTLKSCLSPQYAAPEQWKDEKVTNAIDVYALGCISYSLLTLRPPFTHSTFEEYKRAHIFAKPQVINNISNSFSTLIASMLFKEPQSRPTIKQVATILSNLKGEKKKSREELMSAVNMYANEKLSKQIKIEEERDLQTHFQNVAKESIVKLEMTINNLFDYISSSTQLVELDLSRRNEKTIKLGSTELRIQLGAFRDLKPNSFPRSGWTVYSGSIISVDQNTNRHYYWSSNLWYTNLGTGDDFRWYEVSYMNSPFIISKEFEPYAVTEILDADRAGAKGIDIIQFGSNPKPIDYEMETNFIERWTEVFAKAVKGELRRPSSLPINF